VVDLGRVAAPKTPSSLDDTTASRVTPLTDPLSGGGEMGELMRSIDWSQTAVGAVSSWPQSLRTALSILLETGFPMYIAWGPEFIQFYNDGYRPILGSTKHPSAMGRSTRETFAEIWDIIGPMFEGVMQGTSTTVVDFLLPLDRHGFVEECYFIFSYSPIREEGGRVGGVLVTVTETTERVVGARRLETLQQLSARTQEAATAEAACEIAAGVLAENPADLPFALLYLLGPQGQGARLAGAAGIGVGTPASPTEVDLSFEIRPWPRQQVLEIPIAQPGQDRPIGLLVAGISPRQTFDIKYLSSRSSRSSSSCTAEPSRPRPPSAGGRSSPSRSLSARRISPRTRSRPPGASARRPSARKRSSRRACAGCLKRVLTLPPRSPSPARRRTSCSPTTTPTCANT
jgi:hypothetical protein